MDGLGGGAYILCIHTTAPLGRQSARRVAKSAEARAHRSFDESKLMHSTGNGMGIPAAAAISARSDNAFHPTTTPTPSHHGCLLLSVIDSFILYW